MDLFDLRNWKGYQSEVPCLIDQVAIDSRMIDSPQALFIALPGKRSDGHHFLKEAYAAGARHAVIKKGVAIPDLKGMTFFTVESPLTALQEIARAYRNNLPTFVIAIAGSYGKTMLKDLLCNIISLNTSCAASPESFNSQIGVPLSLFTLTKNDRVGLIEAGATEQGEMQRLATTIAPDALILTRLGDRPLAGIKTLADFVSELQALTIPLNPKEGWILAPHHPLLRHFSTNVSLIQWSENESGLPNITDVEKQPEFLHYHLIFPNGHAWKGLLPRNMEYFLDQIRMASVAAWKLGIPSKTIIEGLQNYSPQLMRTEIWRSPEGALIVNETYSSDPQSIEQSLHWLKSKNGNPRRYFVFGGLQGSRNLAAKYNKIAQIIAQAKPNQLLLCGHYDYTALTQALEKQPSRPAIDLFSDYQAAITHLKPKLLPGDRVLIKGAHKIPLENLIASIHESAGNNFCFIHLGAVWANLTALRKHLPTGTKIMAMVKALAYGTDLVQMAQFLEEFGVELLGVSTIEEAVALRQGGVECPLFVISANPLEAEKVVKWDVEVGCGDVALVEALEIEARKYNKQVGLHLHVDTGMARFGCRPKDGLALAQRISESSYLQLKGVMTHFACAEDPQADSFTIRQAELLQQVIRDIQAHGMYPEHLHAANSAGAIRFSFPEFNLVRIGLALYGLTASKAVAEKLPLKLALSLFSRITGINYCQRGESVSYGRSYTVKKEEERIAVIPIGYFDGLHRIYSNRARVMVFGKKAPVVGKICMDFSMIDITDIPEAELGTAVLIFGEDGQGNFLSPEELAESGNSIAHELITCLGPRIQRLFIKDESYRSR